jgi:hypothetical protein
MQNLFLTIMSHLQKIQQFEQTNVTISTSTISRTKPICIIICKKDTSDSNIINVFNIRFDKSNMANSPVENPLQLTSSGQHRWLVAAPRPYRWLAALAQRPLKHWWRLATLGY